MGKNKNQHFVPQTYLRRFSNCRRRRTINLGLLKQPPRIIPAVSIRDQCSSSYFYGQDDALEALLQGMEGLYSTALDRLLSGDLSQDVRYALGTFALLQHLRTERALNERTALIRKMDQQFRPEGIGLRGLAGEIDPKLEVQGQIDIFAKEFGIIEDLEIVILENHTSAPFITSDDPAMIINRLYSQRYRDDTSGLIQSGLVFCLPLTSKLYLLGYDSDVYAPIGRYGRLDIRTEADVDRLNSLQVQRCLNAIFFEDLDHEAYVLRCIRRFSSLRRESWHRMWIGAPFEKTKEHTAYRRATEDELKAANGLIVSWSPIIPEPASWPTFIHIKMRPFGYTNGSAVGYVRAAQLRRRPDEGLKKVLLPRTIPSNHTGSGREVIYEYNRKP